MEQVISSNINVKQSQRISPTLYQSLRVLQMNNAQLEDYLRSVVQENPVMELDESVLGTGTQSLEVMKEHLNRIGSRSYAMEYSHSDYDGRDSYHEDYGDSGGNDLRGYLEAQFDSAFTDDERRVLSHVIDYLDGNGYLTSTSAEIGEAAGLSREAVDRAVAYIQTLEPLGVGARSLGECLAIQLSARGCNDPRIMRLVAGYLDELAAGHFNKAANEIDADLEWVRQSFEIIKSLNPKPAASFGKSFSMPIYPDVIVRVEDGEPVVAIHEGGYPRPYISGYYLDLAGRKESEETAEYLNRKLAQAHWVVKAVEERKNTLRSVAGIIVEYMRDFFLTPDAGIMTFTIRRAAEELGIPESTVSRAVSGKYLECDRGVFPLKYFVN